MVGKGRPWKKNEQNEDIFNRKIFKMVKDNEHGEIEFGAVRSFAVRI